MAPVVLMIVGCGGASQTDDLATAASAMSDALEVVVEGRALLNLPSEGSTEAVAQRYEDVGIAVEREIERLTLLEVPEMMRASRSLALQVLRDEREAWTHVALGVRTGNPVHEIFADKLFAAVDERWSELIGTLEAVDEAEGKQVRRSVARASDSRSNQHCSRFDPNLESEADKCTNRRGN